LSNIVVLIPSNNVEHQLGADAFPRLLS